MEETNATATQQERVPVGEGGVVHRKLSYAVVGCAQKVHRTLGPGFPESVYHRALCHELLKARIPFESEKLSQVHYDEVLCGEFRMDIVIENKLVLELKALSRLTDDHTAQAISYLKATGIRLAILLNFGAKSLEYKRVVL